MKQNNFNGALQHPLKSGFSKTSTATDVIHGTSLAGKTVIVTGGNTGIGLETTKVLAAAGATVIVPARNVAKARQNLAGINNIMIQKLDLMDPSSIDDFADDFLASGRPLHILINNAGIMWVPLRRDSRGIESQLATNYLAQFHLTSKLFPALKNANGARVINVSSQGHHFAPFDFSDPNFMIRQYDTLTGYGQSKTATNLFTVALDNGASRYGVRAYSVHPGSIAGTELAREAPMELLKRMGFFDEDGNMMPEVAASLKTVAQGAATSVWCATSPLLSQIGGVYCEDNDIATVSDTSLSGGVRSYSVDESNATKLWEWTEIATGHTFQGL